MPYILFRGGCLEFKIVNFKSQFIWSVKNARAAVCD
jgi:hypothetical protein